MVFINVKLLALASLVAATAAHQWPCACTKEYRPVCGSDGVNYGNKCTFHCAQNTNPGLTLVHEGECRKASRQKRASDKEEFCPCTRELRLVCGTNGKTYGNPCLLKCAAKSSPDLKTAHAGPCNNNRSGTFGVRV